MSGIAEVLAAHWSRSTHSDSKPFVDRCDGCGAVIYSWGDDPAWEGIEPLAAHQAAMLTAAGFGPVKEAGAQALEEAAVDGPREPYGDRVHPAYARIKVVDGALTSFPIVERVYGGWQSGVMFYPDALVESLTALHLSAAEDGGAR